MSDLVFATQTPIATVSISDAQLGDAVFVHSANIFGKAIRLGQYLEGFESELRTYNHIAWLDAPILENDDVVDWYVGQAISRGVDASHKLSTIAPGGNYEIVPMSAFPTITGKMIDRETVLATLRAEIGRHYGFLTIGAEAFGILSHLHVDFRSSNTWICSGLYAYALLSGGARIPDGDIYETLPAEIAKLAS